MRKTIAFILTVVVLAALCVCLAACGGTDDGDNGNGDNATPSCVHQWQETGREPATCTAAEKILKECTLCGRTTTATGSKLPHSLSGNVCTVCGYVKPREVVQEGDLIYTCTGSSYSLSFRGTPSGDIVVAATVDGLPVTSVSGSSVFKGQTGITSIVLPNIGTITNSMFEGCTGLRSVSLGDGVQSVGTRAFHGCTSLQSVTMTDSVQSIGAAAFGNCGSLARMVLPFVGGSPNVKLHYRDGWAYYETYYVLGYIFGSANYNGAQRINVCHDVDPWGKEIYSTFYVPASLSYVEILSGNYNADSSWAQGAFDGCSMIRELVLPRHPVGSNLYVFRGCTGVTTLKTGGGFSPATFPNVTSLTLYNVSENTAFSAADYANITKLELYYSASTKSVTAASLEAVRDKVTALYLSSPDTAVEGSALSFLSGLRNAALPYEALADLDLGEIEVLEILSGERYTILQSTLADAVRLRELTLDSRCAVIAANAFQNCIALQKVTLDGTREGLVHSGAVSRWLLINFGNAYANPLAHGAALYFKTSGGIYSAEKLTVPSGTTAMGAYAFYGCQNLKELTLGSQLTAIGENAFGGGVALTAVIYRGTLNDWCKIAFANGEANPCHSAPSLMIEGSKLTAIGEALTLQAIPAYAFYGYRGLESLVLPTAVTHIGASAFENCVSLTEVTVPEGVILIEKRAFGGCTSLTSALFAGKTGWGRFESAAAQEGTVLIEYYLNDPARAAQALAVNYTDYVWKKVG